jgi:tight adherence protein C
MLDPAALISSPSGALVSLLVFLAAALAAFLAMAAVTSRASVKRRAGRISGEPASPQGFRSLRYSSQRAAQHLLDVTTKHYASAGADHLHVLRKRLVQAGFYDPRGVAVFFLGRALLAVVLAIALSFIAQGVAPMNDATFWLVMIGAGIAGYVGPSVYIDRRIASRRNEHRAGFPDFMDLLVVCADAGLSLEASLERIGRELGDSYPSLTANIHMANLEIRAGRPLSDVLQHFADRLALEETRAFATLVNQSLQLGSSITEALRVYSDDMRHKRLSLAEEKAYALPAKLALPMMICIFPVLFVVILLPVFVQLQTGNY